MSSLELRLTAFPGGTPVANQNTEGITVVARIPVPSDSETPIASLIKEHFIDLFPSWAFTNSDAQTDRFYPFALYVSDSTAEAEHWSDLERIAFWESSVGKVTFPPLGLVTGHISPIDIKRSHRAGYLRSAPRVVYVAPLQGLGGVSSSILALLTELALFGASWVASDFLPSPKTLVKYSKLTKRAKALAEDFSIRGVRHTEDLRLWAGVRESWTTHEGAKRLGVDHEVMESIFTALGYKKRYEDQTWRLGETEEYRTRRQEWIDGEPSRRLAQTADPTE